LYGLVDAGADLVLAHHPHVLQPVVWYQGKPIVQSLGNFVFVQDDPWTRLSVILRIVVTPDRRLRLSAIPVRVGAQPSLATGAAADSVHRRFHLPLSTPTVPKP
jgi:poly-gamma-glutamate capsule biosynthesis protein CapA/YwtB (metallophosphatase superfamily)